MTSNRSSTKSNYLAVSLFVVAILTLVVGLQYQLRQPHPDSDQFYHFAVSRMTLENGVLEKLPQVEGLGWEIVYPDKEFLFHMITSAGYALGEERGVRLASLALAVLLVGGLCWLCSSYLIGPWAALLALALLIADPFFVNRLFLVRPHLLAVFCFILLATGVLRSWPILAFSAGLIYALSYHAIHLPLLLLFIAALTPFALKTQNPGAGCKLRQLALAGSCLAHC